MSVVERKWIEIIVQNIAYSIPDNTRKSIIVLIYDSSER